jgi:hypothetical protein
MDKGFTLLKTSRWAPGSTHPPIQWVQRVVSQGRGQGMRLTTHPHVVFKFMSGVLHPFPLYDFMECVGTTLCSLHVLCIIMHNLITIIICGEITNYEALCIREIFSSEL